jgi:electron transport complex protein RnfE
MSTQTYRQITHNGLWKNNPALVQLLGLCPLLAVTASVVNALGLAAATLFVLVTSNLCVSLIRNVVTESIRLPAFVLIIAAAVTGTELLMQAYAYELYQILGIFLPLITTNCVILGRADAFAAKNPVAPAVADGFMMGMGFRLGTVSTGGDSRITWHGRRICQYGFTSRVYGRRLDLGCSGGLHRSFISDFATRGLYYYRPLDRREKCYRYSN